jgi:hypothetical protein
MKGTLHREIRALLRESPEPLSILELSDRTGSPYSSVQRCLTKVMEDAYIKSWRVTDNWRPTQLWAVAHVPPDAPYPTGKAKDMPADEPRKRPTAEELRKRHSGYVQASKLRRKERETRPLQGLTTIRGPWPT